jgi:hypothetical protein
MATLAELWDEAPVAPVKSTPVRAAGFPVVTPDVQRTRDAGRQRILGQELAQNQAALASATTPEARQLAQSNIDSLNREMGGRTSAPVSAPTTMATPAPAGNTLADLWESTPATAAPTVAPTTPEKQKSNVSAVAERNLPARYEVPVALASGALAAPISGLAGIVGSLLPGEAGQGARWVKNVQDAMIYQPTSEGGKKVMEGVGTVLENLIEKPTEAIGSGVAELYGPAAGAVTKGALQAAPGLLGLRGGKPPAISGVVREMAPAAEVVATDIPTIVRRQAEARRAAEAGAQPMAAAPEAAPVAPAIAGRQTYQELQNTLNAQRAAAQGIPPAPVTVAAPEMGKVSAGAAVTPNETIIYQALTGSSPELQLALKDIPVTKTNLPILQRHIEADSLPVPVRLTEGQATGDIVKLSNEQNRRGQDPALAQRFNEQNNQLVENLGAIRETAAPDVYGTKTIENSQSIIDAYKKIDDARNTDIRTAYKALEDANGGQFPVDGKTLATNAEAMLSKKLKTEFLPSSIKSQLDRFKAGEQMTFEHFEAMRTNLAAEIRKAERSGDGNAAMASSLVRQALEDLPMPEGAAANLKAIADNARNLAKQRFDMLRKDPAYKAAVDDIVPADKFMNKFVINGVNKNIKTMADHLGRNSEAHQHMAAGTINWLKDKAGIVDETGNFSQAAYNKALKHLDDVKNLNEIFTPESLSQLKTLGNVARYTQAQPRGAFVNNSNTLVGALAERAKQLSGKVVEQGLNIAVPYVQLGTSVMEMRARRAAAAESKKALEVGAGTKLKDIGK